PRSRSLARGGRLPRGAPDRLLPGRFRRGRLRLPRRRVRAPGVPRPRPRCRARPRDGRARTLLGHPQMAPAHLRRARTVRAARLRQAAGDRDGARDVAGSGRLSTMPRMAALNYQDMIRALEDYWAERDCVLMQPYHTEVGAGTLNPATVLRCLGPKPWRTAYVEPSIRPTDGR